MDDKLIYITNVNTQNYPFGRLVVETFGLDKPTNQNLKKHSKVLKISIINIARIAEMCGTLDN